MSSSNVPDCSLAWIIDPVDAEVFFRDHWEATPLVVNRQTPAYFESLLTLDAIDRILTTQPVRHPGTQLVNAEREISWKDYARRGGTIDVSKLYQLFIDGTTVILDSLQERVPPLATFCRSLERRFSMPFQANVYMTPHNAKGFKPHYDTHDVFILQIAGSKRWSIYGTPEPLPLVGNNFDPTLHELGEPTSQFDLHAGDLAYIPRGLMHDAQSCDNVSLHITVGALAYTWTDFLLDAISSVCLGDAAFRRALPIGFAQPGFDKQQARELFGELVTKFRDNVDFDAAFDRFRDEFASTRRPLLRGQMAQLVELENLTIDSLIGARPDLIYHLHEDAEFIRINCYGNEIRLPLHAAPAVHCALANSRIAVRDLPGALDDPGKLVLARRLVREGLLVLVNL